MSGKGNQGTYQHLGSEDPRAPALATIPTSQQWNQPLLARRQQGYGATAESLTGTPEGGASVKASLNGTPEGSASVQEADPAPENRKVDYECRQAPMNRQAGYNPVQQFPNQPPQPPHLPIHLPIRQQPRMLGPVKTSETFKMETLDDNQYYLSILLFITLMAVCNPASLLCCIPAFHFAIKASDENKKENYVQAHKYHRTAGLLNAGGLINILVGGPLFVFLFIVFRPLIIPQ